MHLNDFCRQTVPHTRRCALCRSAHRHKTYILPLLQLRRLWGSSHPAHRTRLAGWLGPAPIPGDNPGVRSTHAVQCHRGDPADGRLWQLAATDADRREARGQGWSVTTTEVTREGKEVCIKVTTTWSPS